MTIEPAGSQRYFMAGKDCVLFLSVIVQLLPRSQDCQIRALLVGVTTEISMTVQLLPRSQDCQIRALLVGVTTEISMTDNP